MKIRTNYMLIPACLLILFLLVACSLNTASDLEPDPPVSIENDDHGYLNLEIPIVPAYLSETLSARTQRRTQPSFPFTSGGKAIGFASSINVFITDVLGVQSGPFTFNFTEFTSSGRVSGILNLTEGLYNASVEVFNSVVSNSTATVMGQTSETFIIEPGKTKYITIKPFPTSYSNLPAGPSITRHNVLPATVDPYYLNVTSIGTESWYQIENTGSRDVGTITITHATDDSYTGFVNLSLFIQNISGTENSLVKNILSPGIHTMTGDQPLSYSFTMDSGSIYYICVMPLTLTGDEDGPYTIRYTMGLDDNSHEPNNTIAEATPLAEDTTIDAIAYEDDDYFEVIIPEISLIDFNTLFEEDGSELMFYIHDKNGNPIDQKDVYPFGNSYTRIMDPDTYYIRIARKYNTGAYFVPYHLSWKTLATYVDDTYEQNDIQSKTANNELLEGVEIDGVSIDADYFYFNLPTEQTVTITCTFSHANGNIDMKLNNSSTTATIDIGNSTDDNETITALLQPGIDYYINILPSDKPGTPYTLSWTTVP